MGDGPIDLVFVQGWLTHMNVYAEESAFRRLCESLAGGWSRSSSIRVRDIANA
jgi:hypothetical protein